MDDVSEEFETEVVRESSRTTLVVAGELDLATCERLEESLEDASRDGRATPGLRPRYCSSARDRGVA